MYSRLLFTDMLSWLGVTIGTSSEVRFISSSIWRKMLSICFSGVLTDTYSARIWLTRLERLVPCRRASLSISLTTSSISIKLYKLLFITIAFLKMIAGRALEPSRLLSTAGALTPGFSVHKFIVAHL